MATAVEIVTTLLTVGGLVYMLLALGGARQFGPISAAGLPPPRPTRQGLPRMSPS